MGATRTQETKASTCKLAEPAGRPAFTTNEVPRGGETDLSRPTSGQAARGAGKPAWELILSSCPARQPRERLNTGESPADSCPSRMFSATWESNLSATHRRLTCACASTNTPQHWSCRGTSSRPTWSPWGHFGLAQLRPSSFGPSTGPAEEHPSQLPPKTTSPPSPLPAAQNQQRQNQEADLPLPLALPPPPPRRRRRSAAAALPPRHRSTLPVSVARP